MVGHALRDHLVLSSVESVWVLPDGFALADAGVATHVRRIVLRNHAIDQELAFAGAIVHRRSGAEVPTHGGFGVSEIGAGGNDRVGGPFFVIGCQPRVFVAGGLGFPRVTLSSPKINAGALSSLT